MALNRKQEEEEREQAAKVEEELEVLLSIPDNQLTLPQQRRRAEHFRSGAADFSGRTLPVLFPYFRLMLGSTVVY